MQGPKLSTLDAEIALIPAFPLGDLKNATVGGYMVPAAASYIASQRAREFLGISPVEAMCLAALFYGTYKVLPGTRSATVTELCKFALEYRKHDKVWQPLCELCDKALAALLLHK